MRFKIHWIIKGCEDSMIIEGDTIKELQKKAKIEIDKRNPDGYWSEKI